MLYKSTVVAVVVIAGLVMAGPGGKRGEKGGFPGGQGGPGGPGGHGKHLPPFLQNATKEARQEFFTIVSNETTTIAEQKTQVQTWAQKYELTEQVNDFEQKMKEKMDEIQANATAVVETLPAKLQEVTAILTNENQTRKQQGEALKAFRDANPEAARALEALVKPPHRGPRGGRPEGGRPEGGRPEGGRPRGGFEPMSFEDSADEQ